MKTPAIPLPALALSLAIAPTVHAHDTTAWHDHPHEAFFWVDNVEGGHYEDVYSSMPPLNPHDYYLSFEELDRNGNGYITSSEVRSYNGCGCTEKARQNLLREFKATDPNHDGRLSRDDLGDWLVLDVD